MRPREAGATGQAVERTARGRHLDGARTRVVAAPFDGAAGSRAVLPWQPVDPFKQVLLDLSAGGADRDAITNLSAGARVGNTLFIAADEHLTIDRLVRDSSNRWAAHRRYPLAQFLTLEDPEAEADIEGLVAEDGWLWVIGSHARVRPRPGERPDDRVDLDRLANLKDTRARCLIARLPLVDDPTAGRAGGLQPVARDGDRLAGLVKQTKRGNRLAVAMRHDPLLAPFTRIPAKEGGIDIEGVALAGDRLALGMRGPTIRGYAMLLESRVRAKRSGRLKLDLPPLQRLLDLEGLGIRDLERIGDDLLILAGPTTAVSGPCALFRWPGWVGDPATDLHEVRVHHPQRLIDLPFGRGYDHPEGLVLWDDERHVLVLYDSPDRARLGSDGAKILADVFELPR